MITVPVALGERSYEILVGAGARHSLAAVLPAHARVAAVVTQEGIGFPVDPGIDHEVLVLPPGERAKTMASVEELCRSFARGGLSRHDVVVAVGGGVVTDVAGFAAATYLRGIAYVNVATTLLAMVDAAIGGKTGVNLPEGKNLAGAFWQPHAVLCDTEALATLPRRELASGRGEMAKYAFLEAARGSGTPGAGLLSLPVDEQVAHCAAIKAAVVAADEREGGRRMLLNYGHTLAHALEGVALERPGTIDLRHGEAVAIGLVFAAELAERLGRIPAERVALHREVVGAFDLPAEIPAGSSAEALLTFMTRDKKARHDLTFVLDGPHGVEPVSGVPAEEVLATLSAMGCAP